MALTYADERHRSAALVDLKSLAIRQAIAIIGRCDVSIVTRDGEDARCFSVIQQTPFKKRASVFVSKAALSTNVDAPGEPARPSE